jgi:hypothetical protein
MTTAEKVGDKQYQVAIATVAAHGPAPQASATSPAGHRARGGAPPARRCGRLEILKYLHTDRSRH